MILNTKSLTLGLFTMIVGTSFSQNIEKQIENYFQKEATSMGLTASDVKEWEIKNQHTSAKFNLTFCYVYQQYQGIEINNAVTNFAISPSKVVMTGNRFEKNIAERINTTTPVLSEKEAILKAAELIGVKTISGDLTFTVKEHGKPVYVNENISRSPIPIRLCFVKNDKDELRLGYNLNIEMVDGTHWWSIRLDAITGEIIEKNDWVISCQFDGDHDAHVHSKVSNTGANAPMMMPPPPGTDQYNVLAIPTETPNHGPRTTVVGPSDLNASPYGWHDTNGSPGEEYTITRGNNVYASEDTDDDNNPGYSPDGGATLDFDFPMDLNQLGSGFWDAAITNLFYMNNIMHDVWYQYGFDDPSGNFQDNNYGNGGLASDRVDADAQDGSGTNNANFSTPEDGQNPRMQMYLWNGVGTPVSLNINSPAGLTGTMSSVFGNIGTGAPAIPITTDLVIYDDATGDAYDACETAVNSGALNGKIVVLRRGGGCSYVDKIVAAENEGAVAVIVVNNVGGAALVMSGTDPGIGIPALMVTMADGEALITAIESGTVNATIGDFGPFDYDSDLDNGIIAHEYGHGISTRLTGGAGNSNCLNNEEQMGEGWSDWFGLILTIEPGDQATDVRGIGTYVQGEATNGLGIRPAPYSTDWSVNNYTYAATNNENAISMPHGIGFVWCTMLWDLNWKLIEYYGYDPDVYYGTGGNNIAMNLVINALKLQPCGPGFVDGRDAIIDADQLLYGGEHTCIIWEVFANRGLGYSADQGSANDRTDQVGAFDLPPDIDHTTTVTACQEYVWPHNGQTYTSTGVYTAPIAPTNGCDSIAVLDLTITNNINSSVSFVGPVTLQANLQGANYQWIACATDLPIPFATNNQFTPTANGTYAVVVSQGVCSDTSVCFFINQVGLEEQSSFAEGLSAYPNPTNGDVTLDFGGVMYHQIDVKITNTVGQTISVSNHSDIKTCNLSIDSAPGIYFIEVIADGKLNAKLKIVKQQ